MASRSSLGAAQSEPDIAQDDCCRLCSGDDDEPGDVPGDEARAGCAQPWGEGVMAGMKIPSRWKTCPSHGLAMRERVFFQDGTGGFMCEVCHEARMAGRWRGAQ